MYHNHVFFRSEVRSPHRPSLYLSLPLILLRPLGLPVCLPALPSSNLHYGGVIPLCGSAMGTTSSPPTSGSRARRRRSSRIAALSTALSGQSRKITCSGYEECLPPLAFGPRSQRCMSTDCFHKSLTLGPMSPTPELVLQLGRRSAF